METAEVAAKMSWFGPDSSCEGEHRTRLALEEVETAAGAPCPFNLVKGEKNEVGGEHSKSINSRRSPSEALRPIHPPEENKSCLNPLVNEFVPKNNFSWDVKRNGLPGHFTVTTDRHSITPERYNKTASLEFKLTKCQQKINWLEEKNRELNESISLSSASKRMMLDEKKNMEKEH